MSSTTEQLTVELIRFFSGAKTSSNSANVMQYLYMEVIEQKQMLKLIVMSVMAEIKYVGIVNSLVK